jgi:hypothetical protein
LLLPVACLGAASATAGASTSWTVVTTSTNRSFGRSVSAIAFFNCCFHCLKFLFVIKLIGQSYPGGMGLLLQFEGRDLYNFRKEHFGRYVATHVKTDQHSRYAILLNGACVSLETKIPAAAMWQVLHHLPTS